MLREDLLLTARLVNGLLRPIFLWPRYSLYNTLHMRKTRRYDPRLGGRSPTKSDGGNKGSSEYSHDTCKGCHLDETSRGGSGVWAECLWVGPLVTLEVPLLGLHVSLDIG